MDHTVSVHESALCSIAKCDHNRRSDGLRVGQADVPLGQSHFAGEFCRRAVEGQQHVVGCLVLGVILEAGPLEVLHDQIAARWVAQAALTPEGLATEMGALLGAPDALQAMGAAAWESARPDAAGVIADELLGLAGWGEG